MAICSHWTATRRKLLVFLPVGMRTTIDAKGKIALQKICKPTGGPGMQNQFADRVEIAGTGARQLSDLNSGARAGTRKQAG